MEDSESNKNIEIKKNKIILNSNNNNNIKEKEKGKEYNLNNIGTNKNKYTNQKISRNNNIISTSLIKKNNFNIKNKYYDPLYDYPKRTSLPTKKSDFGFNLWKVFKNAVGKDLSHFGVPVYFNEPLSSLQKFCEPFQYADLC